MTEYISAHSSQDWIREFERTGYRGTNIMHGKKLKVTHNIYDIHTMNTYQRHRCYRPKMSDFCKCVCIDDGALADADRSVHYGINDPQSSVYNPQSNDRHFSRDVKAYDQVKFWKTAVRKP
jgi:hypothetical protein